MAWSLQESVSIFRRLLKAIREILTKSPEISSITPKKEISLQVWSEFVILYTNQMWTKPVLQIYSRYFGSYETPLISYTFWLDFSDVLIPMGTEGNLHSLLSGFLGVSCITGKSPSILYWVVLQIIIICGYIYITIRIFLLVSWPLLEMMLSCIKYLIEELTKTFGKKCFDSFWNQEINAN